MKLIHTTRAFTCAAALSLSLAWSGAALAQSASAKPAAEALFEEGRRLIAEGKILEACPKFADSQQLDASSGTLLNLANCYEKLGRTASAWATYKEAASLASANGRADHLAVAQKRAEALAPKLSRVTVKVTTPVDGLEIKRDGVSVTRAEWGLAIPIDPGPHNFEVSAAGYKSWGGSIQVAPDGSTTALVIPALEAIVVAAPAPPPGAPSDATATQAPVETKPASDTATHDGPRPQRTVGLVVGAVGVVAMGVGGGIGLAAKSKYDGSLASCPVDKDRCTADGVTQRNDARALGNAATVLVAVGAAAVVGGVVLWLTAPEGKTKEGKTTASLGIVPSLGGASLRGEW